MIPALSNSRSPRCWIVAYVCCVAWAASDGSVASAQPPSGNEETLPAVLSLDAAVRWALQYNPELAALRQQHGIAAAAVVIAETYPFNPIWEGKVRAAEGPTSAGITNRVSNEHKVLIDVEIRGQGAYRRQGAYAALSRTDWEIAYQEELMAIRVIRAFNTALYRQQKLQLIDETLHLNEEVVKTVAKLQQSFEKVTAADLILARTDVDDARAQLGPGRAALVAARHDLRRLLGVIDQNFETPGSLETTARSWDASALSQLALERRPDLQARQAAVAEAEARVKLARADRFGNPNIGPAYEYDPTRISLIGAQFVLPLPAFNTRRGEIEQRQAERARTALELRQTEIVIQQDVRAALARLRESQIWADNYQKVVLPHLRDSLKEMERLLSLAEVDVLKVSDVRRKLLRARDGYLDALIEVIQARADLAAAVGDPNLAIAP